MDNEDLALKKDLQAVVANALVRSQETSYYSALCKTQPEAWCDIASHIIQGLPKTQLRKDKGTGKYDYFTIEKVIAELEGADGLDEMKKRISMRSAMNMSILQDARVKQAEKLINYMDTDEYVPTAKDAQHLAIAAKVESDIFMRSNDQATQITEERKVVTIEDVQSYADKLRAMKKAQIIEAEVIEDDQPLA